MARLPPRLVPESGYIKHRDAQVAHHTWTATSLIWSQKNSSGSIASISVKTCHTAKNNAESQNFQVHHGARNTNDPNAPGSCFLKIYFAENILETQQPMMTIKWHVSSIAAIRDNEWYRSKHERRRNSSVAKPPHEGRQMESQVGRPVGRKQTQGGHGSGEGDRTDRKDEKTFVPK